ncbi:MAG: LPS-assembly protein LptD, partial [Burkholderiales bacterium]|nr:LPS-assembly protein LptD [Burkholderiales bacterium]
QKVSDNDYFRDLSSLVAVTSKTTLPREGALNYGNGPWSAGLKIQRYQILQDPNNPIVAPYERAPQFTAAYNKLNLLGWADTRAAAEYVTFDHSSKVRGKRFMLNPSISVPFTRAYGHLTPKLGLHYTQYNLDKQSTNLPDATGTTRTYDASATRALPIFSLDGGLSFERQANLFGQALTQTLEPRLYYLYVPYKDQSRMPIFDSGEPDFNFAQIFSENRFTGGDRISDANQATLALTSRFIESETGQERLRASVAQRYFFRAPRVALTSAAPTDKISDFLASIGGQITPAWSADAAWQYDPNTSHTERYNVGTRYNPAPGKLANLTYRFNRNTLRQVDLSGQWPVAPRWQVMGRWNYSIQDKKTLETLGGIEYLEGCWAVRVVAHRFQTATQKTTNALFLQLELSGLSSLGTNPLNTLKQNIGGFTQSKPQTEDLNLDDF